MVEAKNKTSKITTIQVKKETIHQAREFVKKKFNVSKVSNQQTIEYLLNQAIQNEQKEIKK